MSKPTERILLLLFDFLTINAAFTLYYWLRIRSGLFEHALEPDLILPMLLVYVYWLVWFAFFGLYRHWYAQSRLDEALTLFRTTAIGALILFFLILIDDQPITSGSGSRELILAYWLTLFVCVTTGRLSIRAIQKKFLEAGVGARNTLIVGGSQKARDLCDMVTKYPALGYKVVGFVEVPSRSRSSRNKAVEYRGIPVVGKMEKLPALIENHQVGEVLIGLDSTEHDKLLDIIRYCDGHDVGMKIIPDLYDIISGQARINSIYGFPLIEVMPELMKPWEEVMKRTVDVVVAGSILLFGFPLWLLVALGIKLDSKGPLFYTQERVGRNARVFGMYKFRSMRAEAEKMSGPKWAEKNDPRVTRVGKLVRRLHFDEVPQFINVQIGSAHV